MSLPADSLSFHYRFTRIIEEIYSTCETQGERQANRFAVLSYLRDVSFTKECDDYVSSLEFLAEKTCGEDISSLESDLHIIEVSLVETRQEASAMKRALSLFAETPAESISTCYQRQKHSDLEEELRKVELFIDEGLSEIRLIKLRISRLTFVEKLLFVGVGLNTELVLLELRMVTLLNYRDSLLLEEKKAAGRQAELSSLAAKAQEVLRCIFILEGNKLQLERERGLLVEHISAIKARRSNEEEHLRKLISVVPYFVGSLKSRMIHLEQSLSREEEGASFTVERMAKASSIIKRFS